MLDVFEGAPLRRGRRPTRHARYAVLGVVLIVASVLAPTGVAQAHGPFIPGDATATSQALQIAPRTGGLAATITIGASIADYRGSLAQASSQTLNLGLLGTNLTIQCSAAPPTLTPSQLPQPLLAESSHGTARSAKTTVGNGKSGALAVAGRESVLATTAPASTATFDGNALAVPHLISLSGLTSNSHAALIPGKSRLATAGAKLGRISLGGGAVVLTGLRWNASDRTGKGAGSTGSFTMDGALVAGHRLPVSAASLSTSFAAINKALSATGIHVNLPARSRHDGVLSESPLTLGVDNSALGGATLNPVLGALQPITDGADNAITKANCALGNELTLVDLTVGALDGTGGLDVELGGATATTDGKSYGNPFGSPKPGGSSPLQSTTGTSHAGSPSGDSSADPATSGVSLPSDTTTATGGSAPQVAGATAVSESCSTISPADRPSCSKGAGLLVGLIALGTLGGVAGADVLVVRRRRRKPAVSL